MWNDNDKIMEIYDKTNNGETHFPCQCPVCKKQSAHIYIHRHDDNHCGVWTWCNECCASAHMSGETPTWWANPGFVDATKLCSDPSYLNEMAEKIDNWTNSLIPEEVPKTKLPFVMENRFDVVFKEAIQGIPAGATGTIVIQDDFRTVKINFIDANGKTICINETPEKLIQIVKVVSTTNN